jgi:hypothetical protein
LEFLWNLFQKQVLLDRNLDNEANSNQIVPDFDLPLKKNQTKEMISFFLSDKKS